MAEVFVSYSRKDFEFAQRLTAELQKCELEFWIDWEGTLSTVDGWKEIEKGIEAAEVYLFLISPDSIKSKVCGQEIDTAVKNGKRIIPTVVGETNWQDTPPNLRHLNYIFFRQGDDFAAYIKILLGAIYTNYEGVATYRRLQVKALDWERNGKDNGFILRGMDQFDAEQDLATNTSKDPQPFDLQQEYVYESQKAVDRLLELARFFENKGRIESALETYKQAISQNNNNPLRKEIEIVIRHWRSIDMSINQSMRFVLALLAGLLLTGCLSSAGAPALPATIAPIPTTTLTSPPPTPISTVASQNVEFTPEIPFSSPSPIFSVTSTPLVTFTVSKTIFTTNALHVALRSGPHINHPIASKNYDKGTPMEVLGNHDGWYFVIGPDGETGWLYEEWLNIDSGDLTDIPTIMVVPTVPLNTRVPTRRPSQPKPAEPPSMDPPTPRYP